MRTHEGTAVLGALGEQRVRFEYTPGMRGRMYLSNGDPGYPDEPAELWITEICIAGVWINAAEFGEAVCDELFRPAEEKMLDEHCKRLQDDADEAAWERREEQLAERGYP